jgi:aspartyl-tRNA(Asn)/glutamyl-tRNA(Gln) amidotransferase subunit A
MLTDSDLVYATIEQIGILFRKRKLSPVELTKIILARIEQLNPKLNAYITVCSELALEQAKRAEQELFAPRSRKGHRDRGPLHGIPISLKDNIYTAGIRTTAGSKILRDFIPLRDAPVVSQLLEAGAILLGKTNMHEFAYGVTSENPHYGPVRNPWDLARIAGGSSGGSAAAVAAGLCFGSIGTDTGGSIRVPAALCGIVGLKPFIGRVSAEDVIPLSTRLDCVGPIARAVRDVCLLAEPIFIHGQREPSLRSLCARKKDTRTFRLGIPKDFFSALVSGDVQAVFEEALQSFRKLGVKTKEITIPLLQETESAGNQIAWAEATHYHQQAGWFPAHSADYGEDVRVRLEMGAKVSATAYLEALELREKFIQQLHLTIADNSLDAIALPTTPIPASLISSETIRLNGADHSTRVLLLRHNRPANLAGVPAITIPCGFTSTSLPVGLQLVGAVTDEPLLLRLAHLFEQAHPQSLRPPL